MPQPVGVDGAQPGASCGTRHHAGDGRAGQRPVRGLRAGEHPAAISATRAPAGEVVDDRLPGIARQRQGVVAVALTPDRDLTAPPVEIVQAERGDIPGAQPQPDQQRHHRVVPAPRRCGPIAGGQQRRPALRRSPPNHATPPKG